MCDRVIIINNGSLVVDESLSDFGSKESDVCKVVFDKEIESDIFQAELNVNVLNKDSKLIYKFKFNDEDILKNLLEFAIKNNVNIIEFKISKKSLEDTFRDVTS